MIYAGIVTGFAIYYWLIPKWIATRLVRHIERINRAAQSQPKDQE